MTEWMTPKQVAVKTGRGVNRIRLALESGELHGHQKVKGGHWRIDPACIDPWVIGLNSLMACRCRQLRAAVRAA